MSVVDALLAATTRANGRALLTRAQAAELVHALQTPAPLAQARCHERAVIWDMAREIIRAGAGHPNDAVQLAVELRRQLHELDLTELSALAQQDRGGPQE